MRTRDIHVAFNTLDIAFTSIDTLLSLAVLTMDETEAIELTLNKARVLIERTSERAVFRESKPKKKVREAFNK